jgi:EAL domain-containing protein (putative c-di-GMP-specific phosphodiesterase class I)/GGDEF domain-containing protein
MRFDGMETGRLERWLQPHRWRSVAVACTVVALMAFSAWIVYATGGIKYVYSHAMYIPILIAGVVFRVPGGVIAAILGGLVLGPYMPLDVEAGTKQATINWLYRMGFFVVIGGLAGAAVNILAHQLERIKWLAYHDANSELPCRNALVQELWGKMELGGGSEAFHLIVVNADNILDITNTLSYKAADTIIHQMFARLREALPPDAKLFHYHPERLAVLFHNGGSGVMQSELDLIYKIMSTHFNVGDIPIHVDTSIGCISSHSHSGSPHGLIRKADIAMSYAHEEGIPSCTYDQRIDTTSGENLALLGLLRTAIEANQLILQYQPKVGIKAGKTIGVEALIRWEHPERGLISPGRFMPMAERTDIINALTEWILNRALSCLKAWHEQGLFPGMAINVSARNLNSAGFFEQVSGLLDKYGIDPACMEIEVTESDIMRNPDEAIKVLQRFRDMNIIVSIDDFGTGYSSLAYLNKLPASKIKIDQSFVMDMVKEKGSREIVRETISLAHSLDRQVIAEGIETEDALNMLRDMGCDIGQGYLMSKPLSEDDLLAWFRSEPWGLANASGHGA